MRRHPSSFGPLLLAAGVLAGAPALAASQIGVTSAVVPAARGTPTGAEARVLQVGLDMQANERVQTDAGGKAHLLFLDGSALSIGPNSDVVLDEYVYDPDSRTGKIALSATRGVFRLVGGAISKTNPVTLRTPQATIGVRGGIATVSVDGDGVNAAFVYGKEMFVQGGGGTQRVERPGFSIATDANGAPQPPQPLTQQIVDRQNAAFEGGGDPVPGAPAVSDDDVANSQVSALNSTVAATDLSPAAGGGGAPLPPAPQALASEASQDQTREAARREALGSGGESPSDDGGSPQVGGPLNLAQFFSGGAKHATTPALGTDVGGFQFAGGVVSAGIFDAPVGAGRFAAPIQDGGFAALSTAQPFGPASLSGTGFLTPDRQFVFYELTDTGDGHKVLLFAGAPTPPAAFPDAGASFYRLRRDFVLDSAVPFVSRAAGGDALDGLAESSEPNAAIYWDVSQSPSAQRAFLARTIVFRGQGAAQKSAVSVLVGEVDADDGSPLIDASMRGTSRVATDQFAHFFQANAATATDSLENSFFGTAGPSYFVLEDAADDGVSDFQPGVAVDTIFRPNAIALPATATLDARTSRTLNGYSAGVSRFYSDHPDDLSVDASTIWNHADPRSIEIGTNAATNKLYAFFEVEELSDFSPTIEIAFGDDLPDGDSTSGRSAFIDDFAFGAIQAEGGDFVPTLDGGSSNADLYLIAADRIEGADFLPPGVQLCQCQYAAWGFWGGRIVKENGDFVLAHLVPWAAGPIADIVDIQGLTGTATYSGHVVGQALTSGGQVYHAFGSLSLTADFGQQRITGGAIGNYDGGNYNVGLGPVFGSVSSLNVFSAGLTGASGTAVGRSGDLNGSFVQGGGDPAAEVVGHFTASGSGYDTAGILVGRKD